MFPAFLRCPDGLNVILKYDLVRLLLKSLEAKPRSVTDGPVFLVGAVNTTMTKEKGKALLSGTGQLGCCVHTGTDEIPDCFVDRVWHPNRCEIASAMLDCQFLRIPPIVFDVIARFTGNQAGSSNQTAVA
ncbi:hypothetical protein BGC31_17160 [Komagataeibacter xylinus]|nr:hypothetical protein BFX83_00345 [Komagataeibacter xylinus]RFP04877.1 hypothetical protein BGC31_17160 [Komagataeibacter xylinus]